MPCPGQSLPYANCHKILNVCSLHEPLSLSRVTATMTCKSYLACGNSQSKDPNASFHRFPSDPGKRAIWLHGFDLQESDIKAHHRVCSRHFPNGNAKNDPTTTLGKRFASPIKKGPQAKRAKGREAKKQLSELYNTVSPTPLSSRSVMPTTLEQPSLTAAVEEQLQTIKYTSFQLVLMMNQILAHYLLDMNLVLTLRQKY